MGYEENTNQLNFLVSDSRLFASSVGNKFCFMVLESIINIATCGHYEDIP